MAATVSQTLFGSTGVGHSQAPERRAAQLALGACMLAAPTAMWPHVQTALAGMLDRSVGGLGGRTNLALLGGIVLLCSKFWKEMNAARLRLQRVRPDLALIVMSFGS